MIILIVTSSQQGLSEYAMVFFYSGVYNEEIGIGSIKPSIAFNEKNFSSSKIDYTERITLKMHEQIRYSAVGSLKGIVNHEIGHRINSITGAREDSIIQRLYARYYSDLEPGHPEMDARYGSKMAKALSYYADTSIVEFIAEAWSEYSIKANPRPLAQEVGDRIMYLYKRR